jgi:competence protein ComEA
MKNHIFSFAVALAALFITAGFTFAADTKSPAAKPLQKPAAEISKPAAIEAPVDAKSLKKGLIDINSASDAVLKTIPGLGDALAAKIIVNRPYANKTQLKSRKIIPDMVYEKIKDLIIAKQPKK